jgi:hypothetical protein
MMKLLILIFLIPFQLQANTVWEYVDSKLEKKEFKRWSLANWFYQKEQYALQDQWLAMNLDSDGVFVEFYLDYAKSSFDLDTADNSNKNTVGHTTESAVYMGFLGLSYRYEEYTSHFTQKEGALNLRLIGSSHQATHLILSYGTREFVGVDDSEEFTQNFYGGDISLYLTSFLGFDGRYRVYSRAESEDGALEMESTRSQWGAFIDIYNVRIFAYQFEENYDFKFTGSGVDNEKQTKGTATGIRLYF